MHNGVVGDAPVCKDLGIKCKSKSGGIIKTDNGKATVAFDVNDDDVELFCEISRADGSSNDIIVVRNVDAKSCAFDVSLGQAGEYSMNVFAARKSDPTRVYHVHTALIEATKGDPSAIGSTANCGDKEDKISVDVITVKGQKAEFRVPAAADGGKMVGEFQKINALASVSKALRSKRNADGDAVLEIDVNEHGEYIVNVYQQLPTGAMKLISTYVLVKEDQPKPGAEGGAAAGVNGVGGSGGENGVDSSVASSTAAANGGVAGGSSKTGKNEVSIETEILLP
jgi:hypothetical protein